MNKTLALLLDSYRELNSKRLFWITMILSGVVVAGMACVGITDASFSIGGGPAGPGMGLTTKHVTLFGWDTSFPARVMGATNPATLYKFLFSYIGVGFWLSFIGSILGLVSTAGIFPDFITAGSIDLYLSKPVSRLWLFLTKYFGGLLFVTLQMTVFALASFLLLGIRGHTWEPAVFLSIPLVVLMFSYLFAFCVLLGVFTRSTIASLMLTILFWFVVWGVQKSQAIVTLIQVGVERQHARDDQELARYQARLPAMPTTRPSGGFSIAPLIQRRGPGGRFEGFESEPQTKSEVQDRIDELQARKAERTQTLDNVALVIDCVLAPLPKTTGTTNLLDRELIKRADLPKEDTDDVDNDPGGNRANAEEFARRRDAIPASYILGTSIGFELVILVIAAWRFCSRDY